MSYKEEIEHALEECDLPEASYDFLCERLVKSISSRLMVVKVVGNEHMLRQESEDQVKARMFQTLATEMFNKGIYIFEVNDGIPTVKIQVSRF